jgi:hypothetical protein
MRRLAILLALVAGSAALADPPSPLQADQKDPAKPPKIYVVPFGMEGKGQMGTDIHSSVYQKVVKDIKAKKPDLIIITLESAERGKKEYSGAEQDSLRERGVSDYEDMRTTLGLFKQDLSDIPQVMWVKDAVGFGTLFAMAWPYMYTYPDARLYGLDKVARNAKSNDYEVWRKWLAAGMGIANGFLQSGNRPSVIGNAMMDPDRKLSVSFKGRNFDWRPDDSGTFIIDGSEKSTANFDARSAEDFGISLGSADSMADLMFLLGYREWDDSLNKAGQDGVKLVGDHIKGWRKAWDDSQLAWSEYQRNQNGSDAKSLQGAKKALETVLDGMTRYPAVAMRWRMTNGLDKLRVEGMLKELKEKLRGGSSGGGGKGPGGRP